MKYSGWLEASFEDESDYDEENPLEDSEDSEDSGWTDDEAPMAQQGYRDPSRGLTVVNPMGYKARNNSKAIVIKTSQGIKVFIPALDPKLYEYLISVIKQELEDQQLSKKEIKQKLPEYFAKVGNNTYMVHWNIWASIQNALEEAGYGLEWAAEQPEPQTEPEAKDKEPESDSAEAEPENNKPKITNVRLDGDAVAFDFKLEKTALDRMLAFLFTQHYWPKAIRWYDPEKKSLAILDRSKYQNNKSNEASIRDILESFLNTSELDAVFLQKTEEADSKALKFENMEGKKTLIYFPGYYSADDRTIDNYKQMLKCIFPGATFHEGTRRGYIVSGSINQYVVWGRIMNRYGFKDVVEWKKVINDKYQRGEFDGESIENTKIKPEFLEKVDKELANSEIKLYDQQKEGVGFLYHKNSA